MANFKMSNFKLKICGQLHEAWTKVKTMNFNHQGMGQDRYHHSFLTFILTSSYGSQHYNTNFQRNNLIVKNIMEVNVDVDLAFPM